MAQHTITITDVEGGGVTLRIEGSKEPSPSMALTHVVTCFIKRVLKDAGYEGCLEEVVTEPPAKRTVH
jgi:hypothetical protein